MNKNPFNPSFGIKPERFIGREEILTRILEVPYHLNDPWRNTMLIGVRGSGKTSLLSDIEQHMKSRGLIVVKIIPDLDMLDNIVLQLRNELPKSMIEHIPSISSINLGGVELKTNTDSNHIATTFQVEVLTLLSQLANKNKQVCFLMDEAQKHSIELQTFISNYQLMIRQNLPVMLVMASLPEVLSSILKDKLLTFLWRSNRVYLDNISINLVHYDYSQAFLSAGYHLSNEFVRKAAVVTYGYPYLIQLVGYYLWIELERGETEDSALERALILAKDTMFQNVHELIYRSLSAIDKEFLYVMSMDNNESNMTDVRIRLKKETRYVSNYRQRLIDLKLIEKSQSKHVKYTLPYMKEFILLKMEEEDF